MLAEAKASNRSVTNYSQSSKPTNSGKRTGALLVQQFQQRAFLPRLDKADPCKCPIVHFVCVVCTMFLP